MVSQCLKHAGYAVHLRYQHGSTICPMPLSLQACFRKRRKGIQVQPVARSLQKLNTCASALAPQWPLSCIMPPQSIPDRKTARLQHTAGLSAPVSHLPINKQTCTHGARPTPHTAVVSVGDRQLMTRNRPHMKLSHCVMHITRTAHCHLTSSQMPLSLH